MTPAHILVKDNHPRPSHWTGNKGEKKVGQKRINSIRKNGISARRRWVLGTVRGSFGNRRKTGFHDSDIGIGKKKKRRGQREANQFIQERKSEDRN